MRGAYVVIEQPDVATRDLKRRGTVAEDALESEDYSPLSPREIEILGFVAQGLSNREISSILRISDQTVKNHINHIFARLGVRTDHDAVAMLAGAPVEPLKTFVSTQRQADGAGDTAPDGPVEGHDEGSEPPAQTRQQNLGRQQLQRPAAELGAQQQFASKRPARSGAPCRRRSRPAGRPPSSPGALGACRPGGRGRG